MAGKVKCPKCGREGYVSIITIKRNGREYSYWVVKHGDGKTCSIRRANRREVEMWRSRDELLLRLLRESLDMSRYRELLYRVYVRRKGYTREEKEEAKKIFEKILGARRLVLL